MQATTPILKESDFRAIKRIPNTLRYAEDLEPNVLEAQEFDLLPMFTDEMGEDITTTINNNGTISGAAFTQAAYDALLPYIKDAVAWFAYARYWEDAGIDLTRSGPMVKKGSPNSEPISDKVRDRNVSRAKNKAAHYINKMVDFLDKNKSDYPEWSNGDLPKTKRHSIGMSSVGRGDHSDDRTRY